MQKKDSLGDRMKRHEATSEFYLSRRTPVIGRLDGRAFHTLTRGLVKPFDDNFITAMIATAMELCRNIQGCKMAYVQSDEISLLLTDWENHDTEGWFDYRLSKMQSISACIAANEFNKYSEAHWNSHFDSRFFNLPKEEVTNYFIWRQQDATRNSIQMVGQAHFSPKELHGVNNNQLQDKLFLEKGVNWNDIPTHQKRGTVVRKQPEIYDEWLPDLDIPVFTQDRQYIEDFLLIDERKAEAARLLEASK